MKQFIKSTLRFAPLVRRGLGATKRRMQKKWLPLAFYISDYRTDQKHLGWQREPGDYWRLSSELVFQYHKLEKGLCLPPASSRFFGADPAQKTRTLLQEWVDAGNDTTAPLFTAAIETLRAWRARLEVNPPPQGEHGRLIASVDALLNSYPSASAFTTPISPRPVEDGGFAQLNALLHSRRSVRDFNGEPIDFALIEQAVAAAQLSPSACNRQPWHLHFYDEPEAIRSMLALQNGNAGFGQTVPLLAVVTSDLGSFFDASERHEAALDGGLFLMSFLLAVQSLGLATCCLNWCVTSAIDREGHRIGQIPDGEKILTFLAIGRASDSSVVPLSARRPIADVIRRHAGLELSTQP